MDLNSKNLKNHFDWITNSLQNRLDSRLETWEQDLSQITEAVTESLADWKNQQGPDPVTYDRISSEFLGSGPLAPLIADQDVQEILVNDFEEIWFEKNGQFERLKDTFIDKLSFTNFIHKICLNMNAQLSIDTPFGDGIWECFRVHIASPPVTKESFCLSLRRQAQQAWTLQKLQDNQWATEDAIHTISKLVRDKRNLLVIGPTGCGKTSVINACLQTLDSNDRVIAIEDTDEIHLPNSISLKLLTRFDPMRVLQNLDQSRLLKESLRMRPSRLIVGEVRGAEAKDMLMTFATGHRGGMCSLHAEDARQALIRLEMLIQLGAPNWSISAIRHLMHLSLEYILVLGETDGRRTLKSIQKITGVEQFGLLLETAWESEKAPDVFF